MTKIAHITDLHLDEAFPIGLGVDGRGNWKRIIEDVVLRGISHVVFTGDIGLTESHRWFFDMAAESQVSLQLTLGNHDIFSSTVRSEQSDFPAQREELYYENEDEYFKYIYLDSSTSQMSFTQLKWFEEQLITQKSIVLYIHHPILETGAASQKAFPLEGSDILKSALQKLKNSVFVFCGHLHFADERKDQNILQFITPAACYQATNSPDNFKPDNINYGYRILEFEGNQIDTEVVMLGSMDLE